MLLFRYNNSRTGAKADPPGITGICEVAKAVGGGEGWEHYHSLRCVRQQGADERHDAGP